MNILSITYEYPPIGGGGSVVAAALNQHLAADGSADSALAVRSPRRVGAGHRPDVSCVSTREESWQPVES